MNDTTEDRVRLAHPNIADDERSVAILAARYRALDMDPLIGGLHPSVRQSRNGPTLQITAGIDAMRAAALRTGSYAGRSLDSKHSGERIGNTPRPDSATCTVYRMVQGQPAAWTSTVRWEEYGHGSSGLWPTKPDTMLRKVAEAHALRAAYADILAGLYDPDELAQPSQLNQPEHHAPRPGARPPSLAPERVSVRPAGGFASLAEALEAMPRMQPGKTPPPRAEPPPEWKIAHSRILAALRTEAISRDDLEPIAQGRTFAELRPAEQWRCWRIAELGIGCPEPQPTPAMAEDLDRERNERDNDPDR